jgi:hypothetical protein
MHSFLFYAALLAALFIAGLYILELLKTQGLK